MAVSACAIAAPRPLLSSTRSIVTALTVRLLQDKVNIALTMHGELSGFG
jgi:hypothetical protein